MSRLIDNILKYKSEMMGFAIILIILHHAYFGGDKGLIYSIKSYGEFGVDIFLFIGAFTCSISLERSKSIKHYYIKRLKRIIPTYLLIWLPIHAFYCLYGNLGLKEFLSRLFFVDAFLNRGLFTNWYVPAILFMYLITPLYFILCSRRRLYQWIPLFLISIETILLFTNYYHYLFFKMFWLRLPIYLCGVNLYLNKERIGKVLNIQPYIYILVSLISILLVELIMDYDISKDAWDFRKFFYIPITMAFVYFFNFHSRILAFLGSISFEIYLTHSFIQDIVFTFLHFPKSINVSISIMLSLVISVIISKSVNRFIKNRI